MKKRFVVTVSLGVISSMILASCSTATPRNTKDVRVPVTNSSTLASPIYNNTNDLSLNDNSNYERDDGVIVCKNDVTGEDTVITPIDDDTALMQTGDETYEYNIKEKNDKVTVHIYDEEGNLVEKDVTNKAGDEVTTYKYSEGSAKPDVDVIKVNDGDGITVEDAPEVNSDGSLEELEREAGLIGDDNTYEDNTNEVQNLRVLNVDNNIVNCSTKTGQTYLITEPVLSYSCKQTDKSFHLTKNKSLGNNWFYLGSKRYGSHTGYLSRHLDSIGKAKSAKKVQINAGVTIGGSIGILAKILNHTFTAAGILGFVASAVVNNVFKYATSGTFSYRPYHYTYKVQVDNKTKVYYTFCKKANVWIYQNSETGHEWDHYTAYEWKNNVHSYQDTLASNIIFGIQLRNKNQIKSRACKESTR